MDTNADCIIIGLKKEGIEVGEGIGREVIFIALRNSRRWIHMQTA